MKHLDLLESQLRDVPGTVSVWCGRLGQPPAHRRNDEITHYAASTMKVAVLVALADDTTGLNREVLVHNDFASVVSGRFGLEQRHDQDDEVWQRLGGTATLRWLAERMITYSSNLAANLIVEQIGLERVEHLYRRLGARHSTMTRCIGDAAAAAAGRTNLITAADLATVLSAAVGDAELRGVLLRQRRTEDLASGLPVGTMAAHKNGWIMGVRHSGGVIFPADSPPFVLAVCLTTPWAVNDSEDAACRLIRDIARAAWEDRHDTD